MARHTKTYTIKVDDPRTFNIGGFNPTCRAIIKALWHMSKVEGFEGATGKDILAYAVKEGYWKTEQKEENFQTTFNQYCKDLKERGNVVETGYAKNNVVEFLE